MKLPSTFSQPIEKEIASFCKNLSASPKELYEPMAYMLSMGGKQLRPNLLLISCKLFGGNVKHALPAAIAIELFHDFTLVHDDITDNAPLRRNKPSVHAKWNTNIALLSGDAMLIKAYEYIAKTPKAHLPVILQLFNETALKVCEGQQFDMNYETQKKVSIEDYLYMISLKTAALISASLEMGAILGGATTKDSRKMKVFGENIGMLFQLQDDILDVFGEQEKVGKQTGGDIINNKKTFLLLKAMELAKGNSLKELTRLLGSTSISAKQKVIGVTAIYEELNVLQHAKKKMDAYYNSAVKLFVSIKAPEKKLLLDLTAAMMSREI
ncbi:MAG TPA: polyprenyl synthetase family protein [Bacteroidia bacterium]|nr:polyprenyl synthetase family protein [Bacteroidia bacterium]